MATAQTIPAQLKTEAGPPAPARTDRTVAKLLMAFFLTLYLLSGGGHYYSADGQFFFTMARSISLDPEHRELREMQSGFSQWGVAVPLLTQPLVLLGELIADLPPQKHHAFVDGRRYELGIFRETGLPEEAPTVGPEWDLGGSTYVRADISPDPTDSIVMISFLSLARQIPQGTVVATVSVMGDDGESLTFPIRAGEETAEWSSGRGTTGMQHQVPRVASIWSGNTAGRNYIAEIPLGQVVEPSEISFEYQLNEGRFFVRSLVLANSQTGDAQVVPSDFGFWSTRENRSSFAHLVFMSYNAIMSAIAAVLLFALVRLFGYGLSVAVVAALVYGLATIAWPYSKFDFTEPTLIVFLLSSLWFLYRWGQDRRNTWLVAAGTAGLACVATKYVAAIVLPFLLLQLILLHWRVYPGIRSLPKIWKPVLAFSSPFMVVAAPVVSYMYVRYGYYPSIFEAWGGLQRGWLSLPPQIGLSGLLFSPGRSLFLYSPPMLLAVVAIVPFIRRHGTHAVALIGISLAYFGIFSAKVVWHAGSGWGPRYLLVIIPLLVLVSAPLIKKAIEERHLWARYALVATFVLGVSVQFLGVSKAYDSYLGLFKAQVYPQLPEEGAPYGGAEYYRYLEDVEQGNAITATILAWPFNPILAHAWLLSADALTVGPPILDAVLEPVKNKILERPPWRLWGIDAMPAHPENGMNLDFWSMKLWIDFPSSPGFLAIVALILLLLESILVYSGVRLVSAIMQHSSRRRGATRAWLVASISTLVAFDVIHFFI